MCIKMFFIQLLILSVQLVVGSLDLSVHPAILLFIRVPHIDLYSNFIHQTKKLSTVYMYKMYSFLTELRNTNPFE